MKKILGLWLPVAVWMGVIFYLSHLPYLRVLEGPWDFWVRKAAHMMEYAILARLFARALTGSWTRGTWKQIFAATLLFCVLYSVSDEYHQTFIAGRVGAPKDVLIDTAGAWLALGILP